MKPPVIEAAELEKRCAHGTYLFTLVGTSDEIKAMVRGFEEAECFRGYDLRPLANVRLAPSAVEAKRLLGQAA